jgi:1-deoxy-D-xylulose-5-phosphate synthase
MRIRPGYIRFKRLYRDALAPFPAVYSFNHEVKERVKEKLLPVNMFSAMGLNYLGPVDGHNLHELESALRLDRRKRGPGRVPAADAG